MKKKIHQHQKVLCHLLPSITEYYTSTASYNTLLERIEQNMQDGYYRLINPDMRISHAFIEKRIGLNEKAVNDFNAISFSDENVRIAYLKRFI